MIMPDVDRFKRFNIEFGHLAGDQALYAVSQVLVNNARPTDLVARYGREEFVVVLPDTDLHGARLVAERIREAVSEAVIMMSDDSILPSVTVSLGISETGNEATAAGLLADANAALNRAKQTGCNRVSV